MGDRWQRYDPDEALRLVGQGFPIRDALSEAGYSPSTYNTCRPSSGVWERGLFLARRRALMVRVLREQKIQNPEPQPLRFS